MAELVSVFGDDAARRRLREGVLSHLWRIVRSTHDAAPGKPFSSQPEEKRRDTNQSPSKNGFVR